ncbi:MAG: restriction endonuclease subunit S, partial [Gemmatimonadota bacterium]|nr:restriction endonuclease subunit S [Gemmatimonadota bacterium]
MSEVASGIEIRPRRFRPYEEYKDSGVDWLNRVPRHWEVKRLKYLATVNDETLSEAADPNLEITYVDISSIDAVAGITSKETLVFDKAPSRARRVVRHGDVIVSTVRTYLRAIAPIQDPEPNLIVSTGFAVIRPRDLDTTFAAYALRASYFVERVLADSAGVSYPAINSSALACFPITYPEINEQRAIAAFLNREMAKIDALVAKKERLIELLQEQRASLITRAVTKGLDPNAPMKDSGVEWLGEIPSRWQVKRLWHLTPSDRRIMYGIVLPGPKVDDGVPIVKGGDVSPERLRLDQLSRTTVEIESGYVRSRLRGGDLVFAVRGSIGEVACVPAELEGANLTQDAARIAYRADT